jgi:hypothetical protein
VYGTAECRIASRPMRASACSCAPRQRKPLILRQLAERLG